MCSDLYFFYLTRLKFERTVKLFGSFIRNIFTAPITLSKVSSHIYSTSTGTSRKCTVFHAMFPFFFITFIIFSFLQYQFDWAWAIALFMYVCFCGCVTAVRTNAREKLKISGHVVEDFACSLVMYPSVAIQLEMALDNTLEAELGSKTYVFDSLI